jgi:hypothetical protein
VASSKADLPGPGLAWSGLAWRGGGGGGVKLIEALASSETKYPVTGNVDV